jgi:hypothetical protein
MKFFFFLSLSLLVFSLSAADLHWKGKGDAFTREKPGSYIWWNLGLRLAPGSYQVKARIRADKGEAFTIQAVDASTGKSRWQKGVKCPKEYAELDFGEFHYDGSYLLRISDWNRPGFRVDSVTLTPVKLDEVPDAPAASCDTPGGWISLGKAAFSSDDADRREGKAALKVEVPPAAGRKWYDAGVLRPFPMKRASMISFWIKFDSEPIPFWVQIFTAEKGVARKLNPAALGIRKGEWKFLELPVSTFHFRPKRSTVEGVRALQFSPDAGFQEPAIFRLDDILLEP